MTQTMQGPDRITLVHAGEAPAHDRRLQPPLHPTYVLILACPDRPGIVAAVSSFLYEQDCNIIRSSQFDDLLSGRFFMRTEFQPGRNSPGLDSLKAAFASIGLRFGMAWSLHDRRVRQRLLIMLSRFDHCLVDLLYRTQTGELDADIVAIVSNHPRRPEQLWANADIPFHHLPVTPDNKARQEARLLEIVEDTGANLVVLARYMQVLSNGLCQQLDGRAINIHHSFLPSFKGARPYHQAFERGVKLIGATAHYVTSELDEGPIIEQETCRVDHTVAPDGLVAIGRDIEKLVLARAVMLHVEHRVLRNGTRTVVFR